MSEPKASRPRMPGYGIVDANSGKGLLPWSWARERLVNAHNYFLATVRPDGRPHSMPVWGVWVDDCFCFSTGAESQKARNLAANSYCVVSPEDAHDAVVVEGIAELARDATYLEHAAAAYFEKYKWKLEPSMGPIFVVQPRVAYGLIEYEMTATATRWEFATSNQQR
jgi:nitroimidazol reductase NimA-like FMN-containing flavoprotein (pyridoxamine 5'-phosphate oxidase superfamily)